MALIKSIDTGLYRIPLTVSLSDSTHGKINAFELVICHIRDSDCQSAFKFDPVSASNFDPLGRRVLAVALAPSELVGVAEAGRARVVA